MENLIILLRLGMCGDEVGVCVMVGVVAVFAIPIADCVAITYVSGRHMYDIYFPTLIGVILIER